MAKDKIEVVVKDTKKPVSKPKETPKAPKVPEGIEVSKGGQYECIKKCYFGISLYKEGDVYESKEGEHMPKNVFKKKKRFVEAKD